MHEAALARRIFEVVTQRAANLSGQVRRVTGWIAETERLSTESLSFHFAALARGTKLQTAKLDLRLIHVEARCRDCLTSFAPEHHLLLCPSCGSLDAEPLGPSGIAIESLEVD